MDLKEKLEAAVVNFQQLTERQNRVQAELSDVSEQRLQAFGAVKALDELYGESLKEAEAPVAD